MKALVIQQPGRAEIASVAEPAANEDTLLLKVRMVGFCGSDLNTFRGKNPMVSYPRILGHEVSATIIEGSRVDPNLVAGLDVTLSPYSSCGVCAACRRGRPNACKFNETLGVQRDGALAEYIRVPAEEALSGEALADGVVSCRAADGGIPRRCAGPRKSQ